MPDFFQIFLDEKKLRKAVSVITLEQLKEGVLKLEDVITERRIQEDIYIKQRAEKIKRIEEVKSLMASDGLKLSDLLIADSSVVTASAKKESETDMYHYIDQLGQRQTWSGQGRMPFPIKNAIEGERKSLDDFLI